MEFERRGREGNQETIVPLAEFKSRLLFLAHFSLETWRNAILMHR